jgi:sRNA-binding protein
MGSNQAAMARRARERARKQQQAEKQAKRQERREQKKTGPAGGADDPMNDPTIDWGDAVREIPVPVAEDDDEAGEGADDAREP